MPFDARFVLLVFGAYALGGISNGHWICRLRGVDIFKIGSGNTGATNVSRALGFRWAALVGVLDGAKGFVPTLTALVWLKRDVWVCAVAFAACAGHVFSPYLKFKGGKAVSTYLGSLLAMIPLPTLVWIAVWAVAVKLFNIMSVINLVMVVCFVPVLWYFKGSTYGLFGIIMWMLIVFTHRQNIARLCRGEENKIRSNKEKK